MPEVLDPKKIGLNHVEGERTVDRHEQERSDLDVQAGRRTETNDAVAKFNRSIEVGATAQNLGQTAFDAGNPRHG